MVNILYNRQFNEDKDIVWSIWKHIAVPIKTVSIVANRYEQKTNKEEVEIDIVIGNEKARVAAGTLATERADCIAFLGSKYEDVVGLPSAKIVENLVKDVQTGELNNGGTATSYCAYFGNYKKQYDVINDKMRWVSIAGDVAGLRADVNTDLASW